MAGNSLLGRSVAVNLTILLIVTAGIVSSRAYDYTEDEPCSKSPDDLSLACQRYTSCKVCLNTVTNCRCDAPCRYYGDCCADAMVSSQGRKVEDGKVVCVTKVLNKVSVDISVINKCPSSQASLPHVSRCERQRNEMLVRGRLTGRLYAGQGCASCHGEDNSEYVSVGILCKPTEPTADSYSVILHQLLTNGKYVGVDKTVCLLNFNTIVETGRVTHRACIKDVVSNCASNSRPNDVRKCRDESVSYVYALDRTGKTIKPPYRNQWCAKCNNIRRYECQPPLTTGSGTVIHRGFSSLVNLRSLSCVERQRTRQSLSDINTECDEGRFTCPPNQIYKPLQGCQPSAQGKGDEENKSPLASSCLKWESSSNYELINGTAHVKELNISGTKNYEIRGGRIHVCMVSRPKASSSKGTKDLRPVHDSILTIILLVISLLCILGQLTLYCVFKTLRNIPGLILICLCSSLFVAELLFLVTIFLERAGNKSQTTCAGLAIVQHYAFLASFFWTSVMSFDIARMLLKPMKTQQRQKLVWYNIYAWGCPLIIVIAALIAELKEASIIPAYAAKNCWICTVYGLLVYFLGPICLVLFSNIILYVISIVSIVQAARQTKMANPNLKERLYLSVKLLVVMGLPWIFSLFSAFIDSVVLDYIFVILNASQGMLITICYVFSKTVLNLLRARARGSSRGKSISSNRTSTFSMGNRNSSNSLSSRYALRSRLGSDSVGEDKQPVSHETGRTESRMTHHVSTRSYEGNETSPEIDRPITSAPSNNNEHATAGQTVRPQAKQLVGRTTTV